MIAVGNTWRWLEIVSCGCLVVKFCPTLCDPIDCSMPGFPVLHYLLEFAQTRVHWVSDAIQPSHPLSSPSPPALCISQHQVFSNESALQIRWWKYWNSSMSPSNEYSGLISFRIDRFDLLAWTLSSRNLKSSEKDQHAQKLLLIKDRMWSGLQYMYGVLRKPTLLLENDLDLEKWVSFSRRWVKAIGQGNSTQWWENTGPGIQAVS